MGRKSNYDKKKEEFMKHFAEHRAQFLYYLALTHNLEDLIRLYMEAKTGLTHYLPTTELRLQLLEIDEEIGLLWAEGKLGEAIQSIRQEEGEEGEQEEE